MKRRTRVDFVCLHGSRPSSSVGLDRSVQEKMAIFAPEASVSAIPPPPHPIKTFDLFYLFTDFSPPTSYPITILVPTMVPTFHTCAVFMRANTIG